MFLASGLILKPCNNISCMELALGGKKLTFSFKIRSLVLPPPLLPSNMCIKHDWPILFSLILRWQPCNAALLHNWIAALDTVSFNSPNKEAAREERGRSKCLSVSFFCFVFLRVCVRLRRKEQQRSDFTQRAAQWGCIVHVNKKRTVTWRRVKGVIAHERNRGESLHPGSEYVRD